MAINIEPGIDRLIEEGTRISDIIQCHKTTQQPIHELSNGKHETLQQIENELRFILRLMYRLIEHTENGEEAIRQIYGNFRPN